MSRRVATSPRPGRAVKPLAVVLARALLRLASLAAPPGRRERMRREWEAELTAEARSPRGGWRLVADALGAFADARAQRSLGPHGIPRETTRSPGRIGSPFGSTPGDGMAGILTGWIREARVAVRSLLRAPGYTAVAVLTLALGPGRQRGDSTRCSTGSP